MGRRTSLASCVAFTALTTFACDSLEGPSQGVTVYEHPDFRGSGRTFDGNAFDLDDIRGPCVGFLDAPDQGSWDDCISSIQISPGWEVTIFEHDEYEGGSRTLSSAVRDLDDLSGPCGNDWDDCISSIQVRSP